MDQKQNNFTVDHIVISNLLKNPEMIIGCDLDPTMFRDGTLGLMYGTMKELNAQGNTFDAVSLTERLQEKTGRFYWSTILELNTAYSGAKENFKSYCESIQRNHQKNQAREVAELLIQNIDVDGSIEGAIKSLMDLARDDKNYEYDMNTAMKMGLTELDERFKAGDDLIGVNTGLRELNEILGGFQPSDLIIIGARPAMGKTACILNMLLKSNVPAGMISAEQGVNQIIQRLMAIAGGIPMTRIRNGKLNEQDWSFLETAARKIKQHPGCKFYDKPSPSMDEIESIARRWVFENKTGILFVDYLQRLQVPNGQRKIEVVGENIRRFKNLAKDLNIPVVVLAQVKRDVETRNDKRPNMGDISDSSEAEKEADTIMMLYRDEVYNPDTMATNIIEFNIEKNRHGPIGTVATQWSGEILRISDLHEDRSCH